MHRGQGARGAEKIKNLPWLWLTLFVAAADQLTKLAARAFLALGEPVPILGSFFQLTLTHNTGASFGLFSGLRVAVILFSVAAIAAFAYFLLVRPPHSRLLLAAISIAGGGVIGNFIDRIVFGQVTDFLDFRVWPIFNLADSAITVGAVVIAFAVLVSYVRHPHEPGADPGEAGVGGSDGSRGTGDRAGG